MFTHLYRKLFPKKKEISFDEVLIDALNIVSVNTDKLDGKIEMPIGAFKLALPGLLFLLVAFLYTYKLFTMQILEGAAYFEQSIKNVFESTVIIADRGVIYDRSGELLVWNEVGNEGVGGFSARAYTDRSGFGQILGYVSAPRRDARGNFYQTEYTGIAGVEEAYDTVLAGVNGKRLIETDVKGDVLSRYAITPPISGQSLTLSIDAELSEAIYNILATTTERTKFRSSAAAFMDVETGEIIAIAQYPTYDPEILSDGTDRATISSLITDSRTPLLNKIISGTYIPGSIVKPFVAYAALAEKIISPEKEIYSSGRLVVPNKYNPDQPAIFGDWKAHGYTDMRRAIAVSGDVYFYTLGGGQDGGGGVNGGEVQEGLGITRLYDHMRRFGFNDVTGVALAGEVSGTVPNPEWKQKIFDDDWRLGDTYLTSIGQFGWKITPIEMLRAYAAIANGGKLLVPTFIRGETPRWSDMGLNRDNLRVVQEGMRMAVNTDGGTARGLDRSDVAVAGKSGTAELDTKKTKVHTWVTGYFPYEKPKYSFILFMENGPYSNSVGAGSVMSEVLDWIGKYRKEMYVD